MCLYHIFFIYSSVDGHVCCFYISAVVNNAVMGFWEEDHWSKVSFLSHYVIGNKLPTWFMALNVDLDHLAEVMFVRFFYCYYLCLTLPPFPYCTVWKEVTLHSPNLRNVGYASPLLGLNIYIFSFNFFCIGDLALYHICEHIQLFIYF